MPANKRISREEIIDAAVSLLRERGTEAVNARSVARALGCSTQPIYLSFSSMEELKDAMTKRVIFLHERYVRDSLQRFGNGKCSRYGSYGMGFVRFASEERNFFRWLYLKGRQIGPYQSDVFLPEIIAVIEDEFGCSEDKAKMLHQDMTYYSYGLAILANTDHLNLTDEELLAAFHREFVALAAYHDIHLGKKNV